MEKLYKAVRPDGTDFRSGTVDYLAGGVVEHPRPGRVGGVDASGYLSVSVAKTDCTRFDWPARLLEVEAVGDVWTPHGGGLPNKRAVHALKVVRELPAEELLGPQAAELIALVERARQLTPDEARLLAAARDAAGAAAWDAAWAAARAAARDAARAAAWAAAWAAARAAAWAAARDAAWDAAWAAARDAAWALVVRDRIGQDGYMQEHYDVLSGPWRRVIGKLHADDAELN